MILKSINLFNYRNISKITINFNKYLNVIIGDNAQGKTNILESIYFLSTTRSFRTSNDNNLIKIDSEFSVIEAQIYLVRDLNIRCVIHDKGKSLFINKNKVIKSSDFVGNINAVLFSPSDLEFFTDSPKNRRKEINIEIGKISKEYNSHLSNYLKLLKDRNNLLKNNVDLILLDIIDDSLIKSSIYILNYRNRFIDFINNNINEKLFIICNYELNIKVVYDTYTSNYDYENIKNIYKNGLNKDILFKSTNIGIHKDDYKFMVNNIPIQDFASQAQRRLVILAYKLCVLDFIYNVSGNYPILLLDDVMSELDNKNKTSLLNYLNGLIQTIITTTDLNDILINTDIKPSVVEIVDGKIKKEVD